MKTMNSDTLRVSVFREVMNLSDDKLEEVSNYIKSLVGSKEREEEYDIPEELIVSAVNYTLETIKKGDAYYTTEETFDRVDRALGWK